MVPKKDGSFRLILNLRQLNEFIDSLHFKMEDYRSVVNLMTKDCFFVSIDLQDAYHLIPVHESSQKYLLFEFQGKLYRYTCIPFGLSTAPRLFTKVMRPVMGRLRSLGFTSNYYLDDILLLENSTERCIENRDKSIDLFNFLGLLINFEKSSLIPSQVIEYLGFIFDSRALTIVLPKRKVLHVESLIQKFINNPNKSIQDGSVLIGTLVSCCPAVAYSALYIRQLEYEKTQALVRSSGDYEGLFIVSEQSISDLNWWTANIVGAKNPIRYDQFLYTLTTDASLSGWGAHTDKKVTRGFWSIFEKVYHINTLELIAVYYGLQALLSDLHNCQILLRVDNTTAIAYINKFGGCRCPSNHYWARKIWQWAESHSIWLVATYIDSKSNFIADAASRAQIDLNDFSLDQNSFCKIKNIFGNPVIDIFASRLTAKCARYISWFPEPGAEAVDAFTLKWSEYFYAFPPFSLISRVLKKIIHDNAIGILVVPNWKHQSWYPVFRRLCISNITILSPGSFTLMFPFDNSFHPLCRSLSLAVATVSGTKQISQKK